MTSTLNRAGGRTDHADAARVDTARAAGVVTPPSVPSFRGVSAIAAMTAEFRIPAAWRPPRRTGVPSAPLADRPSYAPVPLPPTNVEKHLYLDRALGRMMLASLVSFGCLLTSQVLLIRTQPFLWVLAPFTAITVVYYLVALSVNAFTRGFNVRKHQRVVYEWLPDEYPSVDIFLPVCGEEPHVLRNAWDSVRRLAQKYRGDVVVYVLDDSATEGMRRMALAFGFEYLRRPDRGVFKKAGNLRYAFTRTKGDFILVLDADFAPRTDMLAEMLPYFDEHPDVGIVQSPQFFRVHSGQGWLERGAGAVQELFYRSVQVSRQNHGAAICVGSCAVYRRAALDVIGGTTLIEHSEDVHTGFDLRRAHWRVRYLPVVLAVGVCPSDVDSFFAQQYRWCAGSMSLLGSAKFWRTRLRLRERLSYLSGFLYYMHTALFTFVAPLLPLIMIYALPQAVGIANYLLILPSLLYNLVLFPRWHRAPYRIDSWSVKLIYGWAHAFAIWDGLWGQRMGWQATGGSARKRRNMRLRVGLWGWSAGTSLLWVGGATFRMLTENPINFIPMFITGVFYLTIVAQVLLVDPAKDRSEVLP
jgi:cellulose synthase (UDP-forming)